MSIEHLKEIQRLEDQYLAKLALQERKAAAFDYLESARQDVLWDDEGIPRVSLDFAEQHMTLLAAVESIMVRRGLRVAKP